MNLFLNGSVNKNVPAAQGHIPPFLLCDLFFLCALCVNILK